MLKSPVRKVTSAALIWRNQRESSIPISSTLLHKEIWLTQRPVHVISKLRHMVEDEPANETLEPTCKVSIIHYGLHSVQHLEQTPMTYTKTHIAYYTRTCMKH